MNTEREIKPCPFCGGKAKVKVCDGSGAFYTDIGTEMYFGRKMTHCLIRCERCGAKTKAYLTRRGVFNAWNRREEMDELLNEFGEAKFALAAAKMDEEALQAHNENLKKENKYLRERLAEEAEIKEDMKGDANDHRTIN